ncbi:putative ABC transporter permease [Beduini massiliensis]|uniref:putative ABC transporter permease n=1 Tax=Beduini massiliensis TaxID=1585974 RepID=UPI00059A95C8|nr:putative ABC transporter permease [Beduini massiliensis]
MAEKKIFAKGYCFAKIFIFFLIGCIIGTYYEEWLFFIKVGQTTSRQGLIYGPFSPIYGVGVAIFVACLGKYNDQRSIAKTLLYASLIGGVTEFATSWIAEVFFGVEFWNYSGYVLNIAGRTTVPFMLGWGIGGTLLMKVIYPFISKWIEKIPYSIAHPVYYVVLILILFDVVLTYTAFARMALRDQGKPPYSIIGELMDDWYDDAFMYQTFPVMRPQSNAE